MKKQKVVKSTKAHSFLYLYFEPPQKLSVSSVEKKHKYRAFLESGIGGQFQMENLRIPVHFVTKCKFDISAKKTKSSA